MAVAINWATGYQTASPSTAGPNLYDGSVGDTSTYYPTSTSSAITAVWDLGAASQVDNLKIEVGYSGTPTFAFEGSNDNSTWTNAFTTTPTLATNSAFGWAAINSTAITTTAYRYWRFSISDSAGTGTVGGGGAGVGG